jgi:AcrR family transcriptional regulator
MGVPIRRKGERDIKYASGIGVLDIMAKPRSSGLSTSALVESTAVRLFSELGYEASSMRRIAAAVSIQPAGLYNYCRSKEELLWSIVLKALNTIQRGQDVAFASSDLTDAKFGAFVRMHMRFHAESSETARVVNNNLSSLSREHYRIATACRDRYERGLRDLLELGQKQELFDFSNAKITSYAILQMGMGISSWYRRDGDFSLDAVVDLYEELAMRLVGCRKDSM